jgi:hypothetical protein
MSSILKAQESDTLTVDSLNLKENIIPEGDMRETTVLLTGEDLVNMDFPGSWPMFGMNTRMKMGGYVKADILYDFDGTLDRNRFLMSTIPVEGQDEYENSGYIDFTTSETRFNIEVRRISEGSVPLRMYIETDFWTEGDRLRLRHAYIGVGNFIFGQTFAILHISESKPFIIDFGAGDAYYGGRTPQIRYQRRLNANILIAVGIEKLMNLGIENPEGLEGFPSAQLPVVSGRFDYSWETGTFIFGAMLGQLRWDLQGEGTNPTTPQNNFVIAGRQYVGANNYFTWNLSYGNGSGENIMSFVGSNANAVLTSEGELITMPAFSFLAGYSHRWTENLSSNFSYGYGWLDTPSSREPFSLKRGGVGHANIIWRPGRHFSSGIEFMRGAQITSNDATGRGKRIQAMVKFDF